MLAKMKRVVAHLVGSPRCTQVERRQDVVKRYLPSIFMVEHVPPDDQAPVLAAKIAGTAFVVDEANGWLATAKHVVEDGTVATLRVRSMFTAQSSLYAIGTHRTVQEIVQHPDRDIALIRMHPAATKGRSTSLAAGSSSVGDGVLLIGFAGGTDYVYCDGLLGEHSPKSPTPMVVHGMVSALVPHDGLRPIELYVTDVSTTGGNSGGPVINVETAEVIALHVAGAENRYGYCIPIGHCIDFLEATKGAR